MNRRRFIKKGALFVPALFWIRKAVADKKFDPNLSTGGGVGGSSFAYTAATFNGTNQYFNRGAAFTGIADSKTGIFSCWVKWDAASDGQFCPMIYGDSTHRIFKQSDVITVDWEDSSVITAKVISDGTWTSANGWMHFISAWDSSDINKCKMYINGSSAGSASTPTNQNIVYTGLSDWGVAALAGGAVPSACCLSEIYFAPGQWLDLTNSANVQKFRTTGAKPVDLGSDGSTPTGTVPILYQHVYTGTNAGTGGNLTLHNGPLSSCTAP